MALLAGFFAVLASTVTAAQWQADFSGKYWAYNNFTGFSLVDYSLTLTTEDTLSSTWSYTGYRILDVTGTRNGVPITQFLSTDSYNYDGPMAWPNYPFLDAANPFHYLGDFGFAFKTADNIWYNLNSFGDLAGNNASERQRDPLHPTGLFVVQIGTLNISQLAVPEPSTWALMIASGAGLLGVAVRRRSMA